MTTASGQADNRGVRLLIVAVLLVAASGVGVGGTLLVQSFADGDDGERIDEPTNVTPVAKPYERKLTGAEAAAKVPTFLVDEANWNEEDAYGVNCAAEDFNETKRAWVVKCFGERIVLTFRVFDTTGRVEWVQ